MMMSHRCDKVKLSEAEGQNIAYHKLVINDSAVRDVYLCATWRRSSVSVKGFTYFFVWLHMHFPSLRQLGVERIKLRETVLFKFTYQFLTVCELCKYTDCSLVHY